jgi:hypothetical protein
MNYKHTVASMTRQARQQKGRNKRGRFTKGNPYAALGWRGLVQKRFEGDVTAARAYLAQLGRYSYAKQALQGTVFEYRLQTVWKHPGRPEQFLAAWRQSLAFTLADVEEVTP